MKFNFKAAAKAILMGTVLIDTIVTLIAMVAGTLITYELLATAFLAGCSACMLLAWCVAGLKNE